MLLKRDTELKGGYVTRLECFAGLHKVLSGFHGLWLHRPGVYVEGQGTEQVRLKVEGALAEVTPQRYQ